MKNEFTKSYDEINQAKFETVKVSTAYVFRCVCCGELTSIDDSFSNKGKNLMCRRCVEKAAQAANTTIGIWIAERIWEERQKEVDPGKFDMGLLKRQLENRNPSAIDDQMLAAFQRYAENDVECLKEVMEGKAMTNNIHDTVFICPKCYNKTLVPLPTTTPEINQLLGIGYHDLCICEECGAELLAEPQSDNTVRFVEVGEE